MANYCARAEIPCIRIPWVMMIAHLAVSTTLIVSGYGGHGAKSATDKR